MGGAGQGKSLWCQVLAESSKLENFNVTGQECVRFRYSFLLCSSRCLRIERLHDDLSFPRHPPWVNTTVCLDSRQWFSASSDSIPTSLTTNVKCSFFKKSRFIQYYPPVTSTISALPCPFWCILHPHSANAHMKQAGRPRSNVFWGKPSTSIWQHWGMNNRTSCPLSLHGLSTIVPRAASYLITPFTVFPPLPCLNTPLPY